VFDGVGGSCVCARVRAIWVMQHYSREYTGNTNDEMELLTHMWHKQVAAHVSDLIGKDPTKI
jgi:hypothetical protein